MPSGTQPGALKSPEVADIFRRYGAVYRSRYRPSPAQRRAMASIEACRTSALGGHLEICTDCGSVHAHYHSCRDRHCPKCQTLAKERWVEARRDELLGSRYHHVVFTLPHDLNPLIQGNPRQLYGIVFKAVSKTLLAFGRDPRWIGGEIGFTLVLHTWGQNLGQHVHVHGLVTAGGLAPDNEHWIASKRRFLFPVRAMSKVFRAKYLELIGRAYRRGDLIFAGSTASLTEPQAFKAFLTKLGKIKWVVYSKPPLAGPEQVIDYLGRYTHRIAITNNRIMSANERAVSFRWKDYRNAGAHKQMSLTPTEFIRRFLLHVLPSGFMRIRHFGLFANRYRRSKLLLCRRLLRLPEPPPKIPEDTIAMIRRLTGRDISACANCGSHARVTLELPPTPCATGPPQW